MATTPRYAIYYAPAPGSDLERFGTHMLGYDALNGDELPFPPDVVQQFGDWRDLTRDPRKYGFHATLKAPLNLRLGKTEAELLAACERFADQARPIPVIRPVIASLDGFVAVVPGHPSVELERLASDCTSEFDPFRQPLTPEDRARRDPFSLTPRQRGHLDTWGYPYVMEDFRFHMTLTGRLAVDRIDHVLGIVQEQFSRLELTRLSIDRIALFRQEDAGSGFRNIGQYVLRAL